MFITVRGYHECCRGCSLLWGDIISTVEDVQCGGDFNFIDLKKQYKTKMRLSKCKRNRSISQHIYGITHHTHGITHGVYFIYCWCGFYYHFISFIILSYYNLIFMCSLRALQYILWMWPIIHCSISRTCGFGFIFLRTKLLADFCTTLGILELW